MRTVRELVAEFRGLHGTAKQKAILGSTGLARAPLTALANGKDLDHAALASLLGLMKINSRPVKPRLLGSIGRAHFAARFAAAGCEMESFDYRRAMDTTDGVPWIVETAFGWCPSADTRRLVCGVNWSPGIINPFRETRPLRPEPRHDPQSAAGRSRRAGHPRAAHGLPARRIHRSRQVGGGGPVMKADKIIGAVQGVTKKWAKQRKREERDAAAAMNRRYAMTRRRSVSIRDAAFAIMEQAYLKASANGRLPAHARQIMYAARPYIQQHADRELGHRFDQYFTQQLLPEYIETYGVIWNVVYDARGNFTEPHTKAKVPLGTLPVRGYLAQIRQHKVKDPEFDIWEKFYPTLGPKHRFGAILFIEKEGFMPLFEAVQLAERYDLAIMSTKGMSVTAARELVDQLCAVHAVPLLVLHDFDKAGFSIAGTLQRSTRRYRFGHGHAANVIDLGLRLEDVDGLETEDVYVESPNKARRNLQENGATPEEIDFLLEQRVELNAFASDEFIQWLERKLVHHGIAKVVPGGDTLADAYRRMRKQALVQERINEALDELEDDDTEPVPIPDNLIGRIKERQSDDPALRWDAVLREIAEEDHEEAAS